MTRGTAFASILLTLALVACNSNTTNNGDSGNATPDTGSGGTDSGSGGTDSGGGSDAGAVTPTCTAYCTAIMTNCTAGNQQYTTMTNCMNSCMAFPVGTSADTMVDSLGCRIYHANAAASMPMLHCPHAGPGGNAFCGSNCTGYCDIVMHFCTGAAQVYTTHDQCMAVCGATPDTMTFNVTDTTLQGTAQVACLLYHAQEGSTAPMDHCVGDLMLRAAPNNTSGSVTCM
jgi:hypothetical protein